MKTTVNIDERGFETSINEEGNIVEVICRTGVEDLNAQDLEYLDHLKEEAKTNQES